MPMPSEAGGQLTSDLGLALRAALGAAECGLPYWARVSRLAQEFKADGSIVTEADLAVETAAREIIAAERPDDAFLGEETGAAGSGPRRWILDGIDGTAVFVKGDDRWQSLIALEDDGQVVVGVAILPAQGRIWWAARGQGAFVARFDGTNIAPGERLAVSQTTDLAASNLGIVPPLEALRPDALAIIERLQAAATPRPWSAHAALLVAAGQLDLAVQLGGMLWDYAALGLIVTEAGGQFTDPAGQSHPVIGTGLFSNGAPLHTAARTCLSQTH